MRIDAKYKNRPTVPVINFFTGDLDFLKRYSEMMVVYHAQTSGHVMEHKNKFGKQTYCWVGEYKYWVWDFGNWRVYVNNCRGVSIEFEPGTTQQEARKILADYWKTFDVCEDEDLLSIWRRI